MKNEIWFALILCTLLALPGCADEQIQVLEPEMPDHPLSNDGFYVNLPRSISWDLYPEMDARLEFLVLTSEKPKESQPDYFDIDVYGHSTNWELCKTEYPFWLYQTYRGLDWEHLAELRDAAESGTSEAVAEYEAYRDLYREDFDALEPSDLPAVYGSVVTIDAQTSTYFAAQLEEIPFKIRNNTWSIPVGKLNLHGVNLNETLSPVDQEMRMERLETVKTSYWSETAPLQEFTVHAEAFAQHWTGLSCMGAEAELTDIRIRIGTADWVP